MSKVARNQTFKKIIFQFCRGKMPFMKGRKPKIASSENNASKTASVSPYAFPGSCVEVSRDSR